MGTGSTTTIRNPWRSNDQDGGRQFVYNRQPGVRLLLLLRCSRGFENVDDVVLDGLPPSYQECKSAFLLESDHVVILIAHLNRFSPILKMQPCRKLKCERTNPSKELEGRISTIWKTSCHSSSSARSTLGPARPYP